jgi:hypothetical protein
MMARHLLAIAAWAAALAAAPAFAAVSIQAQRIGPGQVIRFLVADTEAELDALAAPEGVFGWAKDTDALRCRTASAWQDCAEAAAGGDPTLAGDVDGAGSANDLDEVSVEAELEGVLDLADLQGAVTDAQVPNNITVDAAAAAADLACEDCIGGVEIDEATLGPVPSATSATSAASASDLSCTDCIGGAEIDEALLGTVPAAATASQLAANPAPCGAGMFVTDVAADGTLSCDSPAGGSGLSHQQVMTRLAVTGGF